MPLAAAALAAAAIVTFPTADGLTLSARWIPPAKGKTVVVLAHGVGSAGEEWTPLAEALARRGVGTLALDLRGHGGSRGPRVWESFGPAAWNAAVEDLRAGARWIETRGVAPRRIAFGGASIGANLASRAASDRTGTPALLLLSPASDYRGVLLRLRKGVRALAMASPSDAHAFRAVELVRGFPGAEVRVAPSGHGVEMLRDPAELEAAADWLSR